jgi:hypothetical protein
MVGRRGFSLDATRTLVTTIIVVIVAMSLGSYWLVRGIEADNIVNEGAGVVEQPNVSCSAAYRGTPTCTKDVKVYVDATHHRITQTDVNGLYARAESSPEKAFDVQAVYVDTTNEQVNKVIYDGTTYQLEPSQGSFLVVGIVAVIVAAGAIGFLVYLVRRRQVRARSGS